MYPICLVYADESADDTVQPDEEEYCLFVINPLWDGIISESEFANDNPDLFSKSQSASKASANKSAVSNTLTKYSDVLNTIRKGFSSRQSVIKAAFDIPKQEVAAPEDQDLGMASGALASMDPYDAAMVAAYYCGVSYYEKGGQYHGTIEINVSSYWTTDEQEAAFEKKLASVMEELNLQNASDYDKTRRIYDYITTNVSYDYTHGSNLVFTAYGALNEGKAVCQGYSLLFYKMAKAAGLNAHYLHGIGIDEGSQELHAWNGVMINGIYFLLDATWDSILKQAGNENYYYFLKGTDSFSEDHLPDKDYINAYSVSDYYPNNEPDDPYIGREFGFLMDGGKWYWYENWKRQALPGDPKNIIDSQYGNERGREIYDPESDGWYWLDSIYGGAKAVDKEVWMPYIYQNEANWNTDEINRNADSSGSMSDQVKRAINNSEGKWVRYDSNGKMYKGWYTVGGRDSSIYPSQSGNTYYYDPITGLMAKGGITIEGNYYYFDEVTGALRK